MYPDVGVTAFFKNDDASDTASWLSKLGWRADSLDRRGKTSRLGIPISPDVCDIAPASLQVTAIRYGAVAFQRILAISSLVVNKGGHAGAKGRRKFQ